MKKPFEALVVSTLVLAFTLAPLARAELVEAEEQVEADVVTPEENAFESAPRFEQPSAMQSSDGNVETQINIHNETQAQTSSGIGSSVEKGVQNKITGVQREVEGVVLKSLDKITVTVDDGSTPAAAQSSQNATVVEQDSVSKNNLEEKEDAYMTVDSAPEMAAEDEAAGESIAEADADASRAGRVSLSPVLGWTTLNSTSYDVSSRYTAGFDIELEMSDALSAILGYSYSQYDIALPETNPYYNFYGPSFMSNNTASLQYNQNVFNAGLRYYLFPKESKFRIFLGGGAGYNLGYLNYKQENSATFAYNPYDVDDYEVNSILGNLETGALLQVSKNVAVGANFKYSMVLTSKENRPLNNNAFILNGQGSNPQANQSAVGGSIAGDSFYSVLGSVRISF